MDAIGPKVPRSDFQMGLQIFVYGTVSYALAGFLSSSSIWWTAAHPSWYDFIQLVQQKTLVLASADPKTDLTTVPVLSATACAIILGILVSVLQTHSIFHRLLGVARLTKRTSEVDIWNFTLNSPDIDSWVTVRHHENGKVYQGWIRGYSDGGNDRELLLAEVTVFAAPPDNPGSLEAVDNISILYLGLDRSNMTLEFVPKRTP